jgi:ABC-type glycerol-3-phosphate transport system substrate-binding protein
VDVLTKLIWDPVHLHGIEPPESFANPQTAIKVGEVAMAVQSQAVVGDARIEKRESAPFIDFLIKPPFKGSDVKVIGESGWGAGLLRDSKNRDAAAPFVQYLASPRSLTIWNIERECRVLPAHEAYKVPEWAECQKPEFAFNHRVWAVHQQGKVRFFGNAAGTPNDAYSVLNKITDDLRAGRLAPKRAAEMADEQLNLKHAEYKAAIAAKA